MRSVAESTTEWRHELDVARSNVGLLLHKMHAIQWPVEHHGELYLDAGEFYQGWIESPGAVMLDPDVPITSKAAAIRANFLPIAHRVDKLSDFAEERSVKLRRFLVRHAIYDDRDLWRDEANRRLTIGELLPPSEVVTAMFLNWHDHRAPRCPKLEVFIGESLIRDVTASNE